MGPVVPDVSALSLADLRAQRRDVRRRLELATIRARQGVTADSESKEHLTVLEGHLTDELIRRYSADLDLVDSLLDDPYPDRVKPSPDRPSARRDRP